jgi:hypothetical protein
MKGKTAAVVVIVLALLLLSISSVQAYEERISGVVSSVHLSPGTLSDEPCAIIRFTDGRIKIFINGDRAHDIRINEFNTIYYDKRDRIIRVEVGERQ